MNTIQISIEKEEYQVIQKVPTLNLYKIAHSLGIFEITRNPYNGIWKVLLQTNRALQLPLYSIGKAIEANMGVVC